MTWRPKDRPWHCTMPRTPSGAPAQSTLTESRNNLQEKNISSPPLPTQIPSGDLAKPGADPPQHEAKARHAHGAQGCTSQVRQGIQLQDKTMGELIAAARLDLPLDVRPRPDLRHIVRLLGDNLCERRGEEAHSRTPAKRLTCQSWMDGKGIARTYGEERIPHEPGQDRGHRPKHGKSQAQKQQAGL